MDDSLPGYACGRKWFACISPDDNKKTIQLADAAKPSKKHYHYWYLWQARRLEQFAIDVDLAHDPAALHDKIRDDEEIRQIAFQTLWPVDGDWEYTAEEHEDLIEHRLLKWLAGKLKGNGWKQWREALASHANSELKYPDPNDVKKGALSPSDRLTAALPTTIPAANAHQGQARTSKTPTGFVDTDGWISRHCKPSNLGPAHMPAAPDDSAATASTTINAPGQRFSWQAESSEPPSNKQSREGTFGVDNRRSSIAHAISSPTLRLKSLVEDQGRLAEKMATEVDGLITTVRDVDAKVDAHKREADTRFNKLDHTLAQATDPSKIKVDVESTQRIDALRERFNELGFSTNIYNKQLRTAIDQQRAEHDDLVAEIKQAAGQQRSRYNGILDRVTTLERRLSSPADQTRHVGSAPSSLPTLRHNRPNLSGLPASTPRRHFLLTASSSSSSSSSPPPPQMANHRRQADEEPVLVVDSPLWRSFHL